jgi:hypothetical protein
MRRRRIIEKRIRRREEERIDKELKRIQERIGR